MFNKTEKEEKEYLEEVKDKLSIALGQIDRNVTNYTKDLKEQKDYLYENKEGMDRAEKGSARQSVHATVLTGEAALERKKRLQKLRLSPYFGRFDFAENGADNAIPVYIGIHAYYDENQKTNLIHDWRAPISTMFYDFENGPASYEAPTGEVEGNMVLKRQFRIRYGKMEYMIESSLNIHDEVLQKELSKSADDKMKHIVATIQRDQNAIIRNESSQTLIIQGVAGSGKTSIALHRIAFLLYRFKETISSKDILILSPNKVFADYISNVLPELGEEKIPELGMEELANELLGGKFRFQTFFEQVTALLEKEDESFRERIRFKSTSAFINKLNDYLTFIENNYFVPTDLMINRNPVPASHIGEKFRSLHRLPIFARFNEVASQLERDLQLYNQYEISGKERSELRKSIKEMFKITLLRDLYKDFYNWMDQPELFKYASRSSFEYTDVFPLIYLKMKMEGITAYGKVKHLLVDEMQDYTPVQYTVLARLFPCKKTILGDANQSVNPFSSSDSEAISKVFPGADAVKLNKSYRSTFEIALFAQQISPNSDLEVVERHGEGPVVTKCKNKAGEIAQIKNILEQFQQSGSNSMGIVCKTQKQAAHLYESLKDSFSRIVLLSAQSVSFSSGIIITTVHMAKGLEFDHVVVPHADDKTYCETFDRNLLYIACTRAMHRLDLTFTGEISPFVPNQKENVEF
jgi:DNA helicase-2/ATP-dependent DNA helicase PcrA